MKRMGETSAWIMSIVRMLASNDVNAYRQPIEIANAGVKDTSMNARRCVFAPVVPISFDATTLDGPCLEQVQALFNNVQFHEASVTVLRIRDGIQFIAMQSIPVKRL
jgi:hypothetical protein